MSIQELNRQPLDALETLLSQCCAAPRWYQNLAKLAPFADSDALLAAADAVWAECSAPDFLQAFAAHPKIGDVDSLAKKFQATKAWAGNEQSLVAAADQQVLHDLAADNETYFQKFGFIFIVFATGKTAAQMLQLLRQRLPNAADDEIKIAAAEQHKITRLRLLKLLDQA